MNRPLSNEEIDVFIKVALKDGFLEKQVMPNGKIYYKRTDKPIPPESVLGDVIK